ncbi:MAG: DUF1405 domain-containing protein, partial [Atribacterota bacterium]
FYDFTPLCVFLIVGNIFASLYGYYFYWEQFLATPWYKWIFVPDCPLYDTLFIIAFLLIKRKHSNNLLNMIVFTNMLKYGLWTVVTIPLYSEFFLPPGYQSIVPLFGGITLTFSLASLNMLLVFLHSIMGLESFLILPFIKKWQAWEVAVTIGWLFVNDLFDYVYNTYPTAQLNYLARDSRIDVIMFQNLIVNTLFLVYFAMKRRQQWALDEPKYD